MLTFAIVEGLRALFSGARHSHYSLDEYIIMNNPQSVHDVERLEQEYDDMQRRKWDALYQR